MLNLTNKNILLICPKFFGYEDVIKSAMEQQGATVDILFENPDSIYKHYSYIYAHHPRLKEWLNRRYYFNKLPRLIKEKDYVIVIKGSSLTLEIMTMLKEKASPSCKFIMYQWDSVKINSIALEIAHFFDKIATFDMADAKEYHWKYRPLFYIDYLIKNNMRDNDFLYIGSLHTKRAALLQKLKIIAEQGKYKCKLLLRVSRFSYLKQKYIDKSEDMLGVQKEDFAFKAVSLQSVYKLYSRTKVVVDYANLDQNGLTMRTIEALGSQCKLITNNFNVKHTDFYDENNILVYEGIDISIPKSFVESPYKQIDRRTYHNYSINKWLEDLLGEF